MAFELAKAEILWSRICPLKCDYCSMVDGRRNTAPLEEWKKGFDNLKKLGCVIAVFFGAEPLAEFRNLPEIIGYSESIGIPATVITSGAVPNVKDKLKTLYENGCRSLSVSYDMIDSINPGSKVKTNTAIEMLTYFQGLGEHRDVAAIATLTRTNYHLFPQMIRMLDDENIWSLFDPLHLDRGFPGTKCSSEGGTDQLMFTEEDIPGLVKMFREVLGMKEMGYLIHASTLYLERIIENCETFVGKYNWKCTSYPEFPSWVTVDCDLRVNCCDDFHPPSPFLLTELYDKWDEFKQHWKNVAGINCPGCAWNNYEECHYIKRGAVRKEDFTHD